MIFTAFMGIALASGLLAFSAEDDALEQQIDPDQDIVSGEAVLDAGHVDMGPRFDSDGEWTLLIHDDAAYDDETATSVWRYPDQTVFAVTDDAMLTVPDDPAYEFIGAEPGSTVWVVPQTQHPDVVWLGWNTQDPEVMERIDRGVTLTLVGFSGPGHMVTYLQSGTFGDPQVLWDSQTQNSQSIWVDVNTHTHGNWVFTEPGVYLVELRADSDLIDRSEVSDSQVLRFAVGSATDPQDAMDASANQISVKEDENADAIAGEDDEARDIEDDDNGVLMVLTIAGLIIAAAATVIVLVVRRDAKAKKQVLG